VVPAKIPSKVKLENFRNSRMLELGEIMRTLFFEGLRFYSRVESTSVSWARRYFLMERIPINVCILWNSSHIGVAWPRSNVECKIFPFRIPWSSLKLCGCHMALTLVALVSLHQGFRLYRTTRHAFFPSRTSIHRLT